MHLQRRDVPPLMRLLLPVGLLVLLVLVFWWRAPAAALDVVVYTHNIRYDNRNPSPGERLWEDRRDLVAKLIAFHVGTAHAVVCLQEAYHHQVEDLVRILNSQGGVWTYAGVGRDDGKSAGEHTPVLYRTDQWKWVDGDTFWLSPTPEHPGRGWDADHQRIATWVVLQSRHTGTRLRVFATHLDNAGVVARREGAKLLVRHMAGDIPTVLAGDFNTQPDDEPYAIVAGSMRDTATEVDGVATYGHNLTFTGFDYGRLEKMSLIDYVWVGQGITVAGHGVLHSEFGGVLMSDHRPVVARLLV